MQYPDLWWTALVTIGGYLTLGNREFSNKEKWGICLIFAGFLFQVYYDISHPWAGFASRIQLIDLTIYLVITIPLFVWPGWLAKHIAKKTKANREKLKSVGGKSANADANIKSIINFYPWWTGFIALVVAVVILWIFFNKFGWHAWTYTSGAGLTALIYGVWNGWFAAGHYLRKVRESKLRDKNDGNKKDFESWNYDLALHNGVRAVIALAVSAALIGFAQLLKLP